MRGIRTLSVPGIALACSLAPWIAELEGAAGTLPAGARPARTGSYRACTDILPPGVIADTSRHPLSTKLRRFLEAQPRVRGFRQTGLSGRDYLAVIDAQVAVFRKHQDAVGAIIDPIEKIEWQYSTPCYALSVALLAATGHNADPSLLESGVRAMNASVDAMAEYRTAHNHGEFFIQPVMLALDLYGPVVPAERVAEWKRKLAGIDPYRLYPDNLRRKKTCYNHNVVALAGEYLRIKGGLTGDTEFLEKHLEHQVQYLTEWGMYKDPNVPMVYDEFSRQYLASILCEGYRGGRADFYADRLWRGAWTSLFMQSPFGECPTGGRSAQHIWNEAQTAVTYEIYAAQYAAHGRSAEAGAFKRAAHLALGCIHRWLRPDGSGYVVKNRYPPEAHHGYERYSAQSQYNLLACWLMAVAYLYADDGIQEWPCPADLGGFVLPLVDDFHKVFATAGGAYVEYDTNGDLRYNPTGLIRVHLRGSNPQLGPSDGVVHRFDPKTKRDLGGENLCTGAAWQDSAGAWHRLADHNAASSPKVDILTEGSGRSAGTVPISSTQGGQAPSSNPGHGRNSETEPVPRVSFRVTYADLPGAQHVVETITLEDGGVTVEDRVEGSEVKKMRVYYPMLVFDGLEETKVEVAGSAVRLWLRDGGIKFSVLEPTGLTLHRTGTRLHHRNGLVEAVYAEAETRRIVFRIEAAAE